MKSMTASCAGNKGDDDPPAISVFRVSRCHSGEWPEYMHVVPPGDGFRSEPYRVSDYAAYYRYVKSRLENAVENNGSATETYPEPTPHCSICRWWAECDGQRRKDDHLSLVAGISRLQQKQLNAWDVNAVAIWQSFPCPLKNGQNMGLRAAMFASGNRRGFRSQAASKRSPYMKSLI